MRVVVGKTGKREDGWSYSGDRKGIRGLFVRVERIRHGTGEEDERRRKGEKGYRERAKRKSIGLDALQGR